MIGKRLEKSVQAEVVELLESVGAAVYTLGTRRPKGDYQGTRQTAGLPDLYAILPRPRGKPSDGCGLWIEVKAPRGRMRPAQVQFQTACREVGVPHVVGDLDAVLAFLRHGGWVKG